ncbi:MAG: hypothetical protein HQL90_03210 [Magnetococcales bacterium]|nr:hypothetical protein [Magnetococcales bacterium]
MNNASFRTGSHEQGFSLLEFVFWIVVVSVAVTGLIPLVSQLLSTIHLAREGMQAHFLAQAVVAQLNTVDERAGGFEQIRAGPCLKPDGAPWVGEGIPLSCQIEVWAALPNLPAHTLECSEHAYVSGDYKCVRIILRHQSTNAPITQLKALFAKPVVSP